MAATVLLATGCGTFGASLLRPVQTVEGVPVIVAPAETNRSISVTNGITTVQEFIRPAVVATNWITNTTYVVNPDVTGALTAAQAVNTVNPFPFANLLSGVLGLTSAGLAWYARVKSNKARLVPAIIQGVELASSPEVKLSIQRVATALGVERALHNTVKEMTT